MSVAVWTKAPLKSHQQRQRRMKIMKVVQRKDSTGRDTTVREVWQKINWGKFLLQRLIRSDIICLHVISHERKAQKEDSREELTDSWTDVH